MTRWMRGWLLVAGLAAIVGVIGCSDWESSGDEEAWDSSYNWLDFSGMYADVGQGVFVKDAATAFDITPALVVGESLGTANGSATSFSGAFAHDGIEMMILVPASVSAAGRASGSETWALGSPRRKENSPRPGS